MENVLSLVGIFLVKYGDATKNISLTVPASCISESCIKIKVNLNF